MSPALVSAVAVAAGGAVGSVSRWAVGLWLNPLALPFAAGTLVVNCVGGFLIGASLIWFARFPNDTLRLALVTGGLGGLTTFSAFSAESLMLMLRGHFPLAVAHTLAHVLGALAFAGLGWWLAKQVWP